MRIIQGRGLAALACGVACTALLGTTGRAAARARPAPGVGSSARSEKPLESVRLPYGPRKIYPLQLVPGAPFALEVPAGEVAKNIWYDSRWWAAESTPGSSRVFLRAVGAS